MPKPEACFDGLIDALPAAEHWKDLPTITRARLQKTPPRTTAEALAWTDQRLLHVWALSLNMPGTGDEIRRTLDDLRTVRWLVDHQVIDRSEDMRLDYDFANRLGNFDRAMREATKPIEARSSEIEIFRGAIREARKPAIERLIAEVGQPAFERLKAVAGDRRLAERAGRSTYARGEETEKDGESQPPTAAQLQGVEARRLADPAAQAWLDYGPLPAEADKALGIQVLGSAQPDEIKVPDLSREMSEHEAMALIKEAITSPAHLDWREAGKTAITTAHWLAEGRLEASQEWKRAFLDELLATWEAPSAPRAEAGLALIAALEAKAIKPNKTDEDDDFHASILHKRAVCILATGRGTEAAAALGTDSFHEWAALAALAAEHPGPIADFWMEYLPRHPGQLSDWESMQANAHRAHLDAEALRLLLKNQSKIDGNAEALILKARLDAGQFEDVATTLQEILKRPYTSEGFSPTEHRTEAMLLLLQLGEAHHRPEWRSEALQRMNALMTHWLVKKAGASDGGEPWAKWPGLLASLGHLNLALSAARLNVRWRLAAVGIGEVFLMPEAKRQDYTLKGPASAMAGLIQVLALQKKNQGVIDYLKTEKEWPARDLIEVASFADPSFPESLRKTVGETTAGALEALGLRDEARRIRDVKTLGFTQALTEFLASDRSKDLSVQDRKALGLLVLNEVADDEPIDLIQFAKAIERTNFTTETWRYPETLFPLSAATARIDGWMQNGPPVPLPSIKSLRTLFILTATSLGIVRDALVLNVPDSY